MDILKIYSRMYSIVQNIFTQNVRLINTCNAIQIKQI